jgi:hypothetical protein
MRKQLSGRKGVELVVGLGLLLGPLAYALTLEPAPAPAAECVAETMADEPTAAHPPLVEPPQVVAPEPVVIEAAPEPMGRAGFLFVTDAGVVLSTEAERGWGEGRLFEPKGEISYRIAKRANPTAIPSELWSMTARTFDLYGPEGRVCTARLGELRVVAQYGGWGLWGVLGEDWFDRDPEEASKKQIRDGLWQREDLWLVAEIESSDSCEGALWARDAELPLPTILRRSELPNRATEARLEQFHASEELAELERNYKEEYATLDEETREYYRGWDTLVAEHGATAWSWIDAHARPRLVGLEFGREPEGCGDPLYSRITALDHVRGEDFVPVAHGHSPDAVFDFDHDGQFELLYSTLGTYWVASATLEAHAYIEEDAYCPC